MLLRVAVMLVVSVVLQVLLRGSVLWCRRNEELDFGCCYSQWLDTSRDNVGFEFCFR